jgi:hypothetical protein
MHAFKNLSYPIQAILPGNEQKRNIQRTKMGITWNNIIIRSS